eukprot:2076828-Pyramimonas_sp.AAC.1
MAAMAGAAAAGASSKIPLASGSQGSPAKKMRKLNNAEMGSPPPSQLVPLPRNPSTAQPGYQCSPGR